MPRHILLALVLLSTSCILRPQTGHKKFMTFHHELRQQFDGYLINKVHEPFWTIHYSFEDCGAVDVETQKKFTQVVTKFVQSWLQPLREYSARPLVNDFRYQLNANWHGADFGITIICERRLRSLAFFAPLGIKHPVHEFKLTWRWMDVILHELGHLFGLADTYLLFEHEGKPGLDTGGRDSTRGSQPSSIMTGATLISAHKDINIHNRDEQVPLQGIVSLGEDDRNGILWLYKFTHEGLALEDCHFSNYELEESPRGCVPKRPLIFALKFHIEFDGLKIIEEDQSLDVNAQDADGLTALHHAVISGYERVVRALLKHKDIKPFLKSKDGLTPLQLAQKLKLAHLAQLISAHPKALAVDAQGKRITTWGELKKE